MTNTPTSRANPSSSGLSPIVELRQYTLHPGQREVLIELFERALIEPQEEVGMRVLGQFIDRDDPDRFVWLRGFADMHSRSGAALRPGDQRPAVGADGNRTGIVSAAILYLRTTGTERAAVDVFESTVAPAIAAAGGSLLGYFVSETSRNDFPRLPVRENEPVLAWFAGPADEPDSTIVARAASPFTKARLSRRVEHLRLAPTPRSLLTADTPSCAAAEALAERWQQRQARVERIGGMGP
jgi:hypothetical protein